MTVTCNTGQYWWLGILLGGSLIHFATAAPRASSGAATNQAAQLDAKAVVLTPTTNETYLVNPLDRLAFSIEEDPVKSLEPDVISVNSMGEASFRISRGSDLALTLKVKGKSIDEIRGELKTLLDADYYQDVNIRLVLKETMPRMSHVTFIGMGSRGGRLPLVPGEDLRIFEAVYQIGINEFANTKKVKLTRVDPATQKTEIRIIDLEKIKDGNRTDNVVLQDRDIIEVPERHFLIR
jgi:protein involved in polysaccharide export with SLBB domain